MILAYLDAGSGSLLLQALIGGLAGVAVFLKYRWHLVKEWFQRSTESKPES